MSPQAKDDSIAERLEGTRWEYSQSDDRRFLLDSIGEVFSTFRWDGKPDRVVVRKRDVGDEDSKG